MFLIVIIYLVCHPTVAVFSCCFQDGSLVVINVGSMYTGSGGLVSVCLCRAVCMSAGLSVPVFISVERERERERESRTSDCVYWRL